MGQIINSVFLCHSVRLSVCPHSHGRISWSIFAKNGTEVTIPKSKNELVGGSTLHHPFPVPPPKNRHFGPKGPENPCKHKYANFHLKFSRIAGIPASYRKFGSRNTIMTSYLRPEVAVFFDVNRPAVMTWTLNDSVGHNGLIYGEIPRSTKRISSFDIPAFVITW